MTWQTELLVCGPFSTLLIAVVLRLIALSQPESSWGHRRVWVMTRIAYLLMAISTVGMVCLFFAVPAVGVIGLLTVIVFLAFFIGTELRFAGVRNRARQTEFLWVLAMAVESGRPLADEIEAYAMGISGKRHRLLSDMVERLREGTSLTELVVPQGLLPASAGMQIHAGITSQSLVDSIVRSAHRATEEFGDDQESEFPGGAVAYPPALLMVAMLIISFVCYYIIPKLKRIFEDFNTELPDITIGMIHLSDAFVKHWFVLGLPLFVYFPVAVFVLVGIFEFYGWNATMQSFFGRWFARWYTPDILRSLAQSFRQNVSMKEALVPIVRYAGPVHLRRKLTLAAEEMDEGVKEWEALQHQGVINFHEAVVLEVAQQSGNLPWALDSLASKIERRRTFRIRAFLEFLQPLLVIPVGILAGLIALAMFIPLIKLLYDLS